MNRNQVERLKLLEQKVEALEMLNATGESKSNGEDTVAIKWLRCHITEHGVNRQGEYWVNSNYIKTAAVEAGISALRLQRARASLGCEARQHWAPGKRSWFIVWSLDWGK